MCVFCVFAFLWRHVAHVNASLVTTSIIPTVPQTKISQNLLKLSRRDNNKLTTFSPLSNIHRYSWKLKLRYSPILLIKWNFLPIVKRTSLLCQLDNYGNKKFSNFFLEKVSFDVTENFLFSTDFWLGYTILKLLNAIV